MSSPPNIYLQLTGQFNDGKLRCVISSGQAVVLHRLAIMSKDGDWILREDAETTEHVLRVLDSHRATYRFGAPLDVRWLKGGWSSHFEFTRDSLRVRTDFVTRPPRLTTSDLDRLWKEQSGRPTPFLDARDLADVKKTDREKDYAVIGELARLMNDVRDQLLYSRSARDLSRLANENPAMVKPLAARRPLLTLIASGQDALEVALDAERRALMHANEKRLDGYRRAAERWASLWPTLDKEITGRSLLVAHSILVKRAEGVLPFHSQGEAQ
ncbi:MAG: hypothetical protein EXS18_03975 [Verrucomicrobiae bacterium]|nr:hypothetical protein [Verrucomicrobiae bacterium]